MEKTPLIVTVLILVATLACESKKQQETEFVPPGTYKTRAEAQAFADRENADLASIRAEEKAKGVRAQDLACGKYEVVSIRNSDGREFWGTHRDTAGCPDQTPSFNSLTQPQRKTGGPKP